LRFTRSKGVGTVQWYTGTQLKRKMSAVTINRFEYIRRAIAEREERKEAAAKLLDSLQRGSRRVPKEFVNEAVRKAREER
jgi:hypothetical protein